MRLLLALPSAVIARLDLVWQGPDLDELGTCAFPPDVPSILVDQRRAKG